MIKYAKHDWICLLDVDDLWMPEKLSSQIPYTEYYDVIGTNCKYFDDSDISPPLPFVIYLILIFLILILLLIVVV